MKKASLLFLLALVGVLFLAGEASANPFTGGSPSGMEAAFAMPALRDLIAIQQRIYASLASEIHALKEADSLRPLLHLLLLSFLYGIFHVLGPGHGKSIVGSWFIGHSARFRDGLWAGVIVSAGHTITAILLVGVLNVLMHVGQLDVLDRALYGEAVGYGLITLIGLWLVFKALRKKTAGCSCCCGCSSESVVRNKEALSLFGIAGLVPCTGSMIILLFTLAQGVFWAGLLGTLAVALGMVLAIACIGMATIFMRRSFVDRPDPSPLRKLVLRGLELAAALLVLLTGLTFLAGTLYGIFG